jgi:hypothetical protein
MMTSANTPSKAVLWRMKGVRVDAERRILRRGDIVMFAQSNLLSWQ